MVFILFSPFLPLRGPYSVWRAETAALFVIWEVFLHGWTKQKAPVLFQGQVHNLRCHLDWYVSTRFSRNASTFPTR